LNPGILLGVFVGGALGSLARFLILLGFESVALPSLSLELFTTAIVNLTGAWLLGVVNSQGFRAGEKAKALWGTGFAGGFTTMSGLAVITTSAGLGLAEMGYLFWLGVLLQLAIGIVAYWLGSRWSGFNAAAASNKDVVV
jgi:fluoride ion exporter CrcB/FEX